MTFKWPEKTRRRVHFSNTHFTDETYQSYYGNRNVLAMTSTRALYRDRIYPCQFLLIWSYNSFAFQSFIGDRRSSQGRNTWSIYKIDSFIEDILVDGLLTDGPEMRGGTGRIRPIDCKGIVKLVSDYRSNNENHS